MIIPCVALVHQATMAFTVQTGTVATVKLEPIAVVMGRARVERSLQTDSSSARIVKAIKDYDVLGPVIATSLLQDRTIVGYSSCAYTHPITIGTLAAWITF